MYSIDIMYLIAHRSQHQISKIAGIILKFIADPHSHSLPHILVHCSALSHCRWYICSGSHDRLSLTVTLHILLYSSLFSSAFMLYSAIYNPFSKVFKEYSQLILVFMVYGLVLVVYMIHIALF